MDTVRLISATADDLPLLAEWLNREHVRRWWGEPEKVIAQLKNWTGQQAIIEANGRKVGYVCWDHPPCAELEEAGLSDIPATVVDIDIMIGEQGALGQGIGSRAIQLAVDGVFSEFESIPVVMACAAQGNHASIKACLKAGLRIEREFDDPAHGPSVLMWRGRYDEFANIGSIRSAATDDMQTLLPMMHEFNRLDGIEWKSERCAAAVDRLLRNGDLGFLLVVERTGLIGYAVVTYNYDLEFGGRDALITEMYVHPDARREGVATALFKAVEERARKEGVLAIHLQVRPENRNATRLYTKLGYELVPRETMTKVLD